MKNLILFLTLVLFSMNLHSAKPAKPSKQKASASVLSLTFAQFKEGLSKNKDEAFVRVSPDLNKEAIRAANPNAKLQNRWLTRQAIANCSKLIIKQVWENFYPGHMYEDYNFEFCADINEAVVSYNVQMPDIAYTCIAEKGDLLNGLFPNVKNDTDVVVEASRK